jgi:hypothetical protein
LVARKVGPVPHASIRRLSVADLDDNLLRRLVEHGEDLFVERKREPPAGSRLGAAVASFANTLGGWLLLGVDDSRAIVGFAPAERTDPQSYFGQVLANQVDPLPPFVADVRVLDGTPLTVLRVFESADTPHVLTDSGAVYTRDARGKQPVTEQRLLLELARRGREALAAAHARVTELELLVVELATLDLPTRIAVDTSMVAVVARAYPLTVTPQFAAWAISTAALEACKEHTRTMAETLETTVAEPIVHPRGRGFGVHWSGPQFSGGRAGSIAVDSGGGVGAKFSHGEPGNARLDAAELRKRHLPVVIETVASMLDSAEVVGRVLWHFWITTPFSTRVVTSVGLRDPSRAFYASREFTVPATADERDALAGEIIREYVREAGAPEFE